MQWTPQLFGRWFGTLPLEDQDYEQNSAHSAWERAFVETVSCFGLQLLGWMIEARVVDGVGLTRSMQLMRAVERHMETVIRLISSLGLLKIGFMLIECALVFIALLSLASSLVAVIKVTLSLELSHA